MMIGTQVLLLVWVVLVQSADVVLGRTIINSKRDLLNELNVNSRETTIPRSIGSLTDLTNLRLVWGFEGTIPEEIGQLTNLERLEIESCDFRDGTIPNAIGNLTKLTLLSLSSNKLRGPIPTTIGNCSLLKQLQLDKNALTGQVPEEVGNLTGLTSLDLSNNDLEGSFPNIFHASGLLNLDLRNNKFSGTVPHALDDLVQLEALDISSNGFNGTFAVTLANMTQMWKLDISANDFTSSSFSIDENRLKSLREINLQLNRFNGEFPFGALEGSQTLTKLGISFNNFTGTIPISFGAPRLSTFLASSNSLSGPLPRKMAEMSDLELLDLSSNQLSGNLPGRWPEKLKWLDLSSNRLSGNISNLVFGSELKQLILANNGFDGTVPASLGNLSELELLDISGNRFTGFSQNVGKLGNGTLKSFNAGGLIVDCHCTMATWLDPLLNKSDLTFINPDNIICSGVNEFSELPAHRIRYLPDEPCTNPFNVISSMPSDPRSLHVSWSYENDEDVSYYNWKTHDHPEVWDAYTFDFVDPYSALDIPGVNESGMWSCDSLDMYTEIQNATLAYEVEWENLNELVQQDDAKYGRRCTWNKQIVLDQLLEPFTPYSITVRALHIRWDIQDLKVNVYYHPRVSMGPRSAPILAKTNESVPEGAPLLVRVPEAGKNEYSVTVSWKAPKKPNGIITGYEFEVEGRQPERWNDTSKTIGGFTPDQNYRVRVRAWTKVGPGPYSEYVPFTTLTSCPLGYERDQIGNRTCVQCPLHKYRSIQFERCQSCPDQTPVTLQNATTSRDGCVTSPGLFKVSQNRTMSCADIPGTECPVPGLNVETLPIKTGFWRVSSTTLDVRECPEPTYCASSQVVDPLLRTCPGKMCCKAHHEGVYCMSCEENYTVKSGGCTECTDTLKARDKRLTITFAVIAAVLAVIPVVLIIKTPGSTSLTDRACGKGFQKRAKTLLRTMRRILGAKGRIMIGFFQVLWIYVSINHLLQNDKPGQVIFNFDLSALLSAFNVGCVVPLNFYGRLVIYTAYPLVLILLSLLALALVMKLKPNEVDRALKTTMSFILHLLFLIFPGLSSTIIGTFRYDEFPHDDGNGTVDYTLQTDHTIDYYSDISKTFRIYAGIMVVVYPIGVTVLFFWVAIWASKHEKSSVARAAEFLIRDVKRPWFEGYDLVRKFFQTSVYLLIHQRLDDTFKSQLTFFLFTSIAVNVLLQLRPYKSYMDHVYAVYSQIMLGVTCYISSVIREEQEYMLALVITVSILQLSVFIFVMLIEIKQHKKAAMANEHDIDDDTDDDQPNTSSQDSDSFVFTENPMFKTEQPSKNAGPQPTESVHVNVPEEEEEVEGQDSELSNLDVDHSDSAASSKPKSPNQAMTSV